MSDYEEDHEDDDEDCDEDCDLDDDDDEEYEGEDDSIVCPWCGELAWLMDGVYVCDACGDLEK